MLNHTNFVVEATVARFFKFVEIDLITGAWIWKGGLTGNGYGAFWYQGKTVSAYN